jgi:hypothetical protein
MPATTSIPPVLPRHERKFGWLLGGAALVALVGVALLVRFNPAEHSFFPRCLFFTMSGWECPGCGGQRALHHLLHGQLGLALKHNALLLLLLPLGVWQVTRWIWEQRTGQRLPSLFQNHRWAWLLVVVVIGFAVLRNVPGAEWLRP